MYSIKFLIVQARLSSQKTAAMRNIRYPYMNSSLFGNGFRNKHSSERSSSESDRTMSTTYRSIPPITHQRDIYGQAVTALSFDPVSDTLWAGSSAGTVVAYHGTRSVRGVCFPVGGSLPVRNIIAGENYVRALGHSGEGVGSWGKGGVNKWFFK